MDQFTAQLSEELKTPFLKHEWTPVQKERFESFLDQTKDQPFTEDFTRDNVAAFLLDTRFDVFRLFVQAKKVYNVDVKIEFDSSLIPEHVKKTMHKRYHEKINELIKEQISIIPNDKKIKKIKSTEIFSKGEYKLLYEDEDGSEICGLFVEDYEAEDTEIYLAVASSMIEYLPDLETLEITIHDEGTDEYAGLYCFQNAGKIKNLKFWMRYPQSIFNMLNTMSDSFMKIENIYVNDVNLSSKEEIYAIDQISEIEPHEGSPDEIMEDISEHNEFQDYEREFFSDINNVDISKCHYGGRTVYDFKELFDHQYEQFEYIRKQ